MGIQIQGNGGTIAEVGGSTFRALSTQVKPLEHGVLGHYTWGGFSGIIPQALTANSEILQFQWTDATRFAVIRKIRISAAVSTTFFAAGVPMQLNLLKATAWSAVGTGGTRPAIQAQLKKRTNMGSSLLAANNVGIATTAALGAGTKTLETTPLQSIVASCPITASLNGTIIAPGTIFWQAEVGDAEHPLVLAQNEGFVITCAQVPATGTWQFATQVDWAEVNTY